MPAGSRIAACPNQRYTMVVTDVVAQYVLREFEHLGMRDQALKIGVIFCGVHAGRFWSWSRAAGDIVDLGEGSCQLSLNCIREQAGKYEMTVEV